jgi:hypothetical protein
LLRPGERRGNSTGQRRQEEAAAVHHSTLISQGSDRKAEQETR